MWRFLKPSESLLLLGELPSLAQPIAMYQQESYKIQTILLYSLRVLDGWPTSAIRDHHHHLLENA